MQQCAHSSPPIASRDALGPAANILFACYLGPTDGLTLDAAYTAKARAGLARPSRPFVSVIRPGRRTVSLYTD